MLPAVAGLAEPRLVSILVTAIAISLAVTPPVSNLGRKLAGGCVPGRAIPSWRATMRRCC
ncbi:MAG: hypothetical protein ACK57E_08945 [Erythrobacteraceae bacterium]